MNQMSLSGWGAEKFRPAHQAERSATVPEIRLLEFGEAVADCARWDELGEAAGLGDIFTQPWFMRPSLQHFAPRRGMSLAVAQRPDGEWVGMLPIAPAMLHGRMPLPHWTGCDHPNQFIGGPLVKAGEEQEFWVAMLAALDRSRELRFGLRLAKLPLDAPATAALFDLCREQRRDILVESVFERATLVARSLQADRWHAGLKSSFRRRIEGLWRKLDREAGPTEFVTTRRAEEIGPWIEAFLRLEDSGWKGQAKSSLASRQATHAFYEDVVRAAARRGELEIAALVTAGRILAISTHFVAGERGFGFKMAFDQAYRSYAPGLLLLHRLTRHLIDCGVAEFDSCSAPDQQPISRLWAERRAFINCTLALGGKRRRAVFRAFRDIERSRKPDVPEIPFR